MIKHLAHACLSSSDLDETRKFYCGALGLKEHFTFIKNGAETGLYLEICAGNYLEFFLGAPSVSDNNVIKHLCLETDSIDDAIKRIKAEGYEATDRKLGADNSWQAWTTDPDGARIELHEYTPESSQHTRQNPHL